MGCHVLVSDNGPQFTANEFSECMQTNGITHLRGAPYHLATNGEAERFVQTFKQALQKGEMDKGTKLAQFLLVNRTVPHSMTGVAPAHLFMKRPLRTRLDLLRPLVKEHVEAEQQQQQQYHDHRARKRGFEMERPVLARNFCEEPRWMQGQIVRKSRDVSYEVRLGDQVWKQHTDQLLAYQGTDPTEAGLQEPGSATQPEPLNAGANHTTSG